MRARVEVGAEVGCVGPRERHVVAAGGGVDACTGSVRRPPRLRSSAATVEATSLARRTNVPEVGRHAPRRSREQLGEFLPLVRVGAAAGGRVAQRATLRRRARAARSAPPARRGSRQEATRRRERRCAPIRVPAEVDLRERRAVRAAEKVDPAVAERAPRPPRCRPQRRSSCTAADRRRDERSSVAGTRLPPPRRRRARAHVGQAIRFDPPVPRSSTITRSRSRPI